jgi:hypothetical protein
MRMQPTRLSDVWPVTHQRDHGYALVPCQAPGCRRLFMLYRHDREGDGRSRQYCDDDCRLQSAGREQAQPMKVRTA